MENYRIWNFIIPSRSCTRCLYDDGTATPPHRHLAAVAPAAHLFPFASFDYRLRKKVLIEKKYATKSSVMASKATSCLSDLEANAKRNGVTWKQQTVHEVNSISWFDIFMRTVGHAVTSIDFDIVCKKAFMMFITWKKKHLIKHIRLICKRKNTYYKIPLLQTNF